MGFRSWSKAIRELDWNINWSVAVGKETNGAKIDVCVKHIPGTGVPTTTTVLSNHDVTASVTSEFEVMGDLVEHGPAGSQFKLNGEPVRGLHAIDIPDPSDVNQKFHLVVKNTGTAPVTVFDGFVSIRKLYPGESVVREETDDIVLSAEEATALQGRYDELNTTPYLEGFLFAATTFINSDPFPADLKAEFANLSAASTTADLQAVLNSSAYQTYYSTSFPRRPFPVYINPQIGGQEVACPVELAPGDEVEFDFTLAIISFYFDKLSFS